MKNINFVDTLRCDMTTVAWSMVNHGMLIMEHGESLKTFHDHTTIMERVSCSMDYGKAAMVYLHPVKPAITSITETASNLARGH